MIFDFFRTYQYELITSGIVLLSLLIIRYILNFTITKIARKNNINEARIRLIRRYVTFIFLLVALLIEGVIFGADLNKLTVIFSSVFAVIGIGLFAIWSILSNITSGVIMVFALPYKVGDKVKIHDSDFPVEAIIEDIGAFQVRLRVDNGDLVAYPNSLMLQKAVTIIKKDAIDEDDYLI
jgi:small-conductance mechanosensitive channel